VLGEDEAAFGLGDGPAKFLGRFDPLLDDDFDAGQSFLVGLAVGREGAGLRNS